MAVDRCTTHGGLRFHTSAKFRILNGKAYAVCGSLAEGLAFMDWIETPTNDPCPLSSETCVVMLDLETGQYGSWEFPGMFIRSEDKFEAWGSGGHLAIGAMAAGATAEEAVKIAAAWDEGTGFGVLTARAKPKATRKRARKPEVAE